MTAGLYEHAAYYRMLHHDRASDLPFYLEHTTDCPRVLEYGVGNGRVALPLARRGQAVTGVDLSAAMLASFADDLRREPPEVRDRVRLVEGDARTTRLGERFDAVTCPFNGICHHHTLEQLGAFFDRAREHLTPAGRLVFDVAVPSPSLLSGTTSTIPWFRDPVDGVVCRATEQIEYDPLSQCMTITLTSRAMDEPRDDLVMTLRLRQLFPQETMLLLRHHGFVVEHREDLGDVLGYVCRAEQRGW